MIQPILLVSFAGRRPSEAVSRGVELATRFNTSLHVVFIADGFASTGWGDEAWFDAEVPAAIERHYQERTGQVVHETIHYAQAHAVKVIVLAPNVSKSGSCVTAIVAATKLPVLVARTRTTGDAVIAGTDLSDMRFPVLQLAAEMIDTLDTRLVGVHNVRPETSEPEIVHRRNKLATALDAIAVSPELVIDCEPDPADAVLSAARERDADLIVVGAPSRGWMDSLLYTSVASRVVTCAPTSVLVTPR